MGGEDIKKTKVDGENGQVARGEKKEGDARFLIEKRHMGLIIGKGGARIKAMRDEAGVYASILKIDGPHADHTQERVMVLQGDCNQISHAVRSISQLIVDNQIEREQKNSTGGEVSAGAQSAKVTILFDSTQAGAIIGKGGATIKATQAETGAKMQVSKDVLANSTERSCQITGTADVLEAATLAVLLQLKEYPSQSNKSQHYVPSAGPMPGSLPYGADPYAATSGFGTIGQAPAYAQSFQSPFQNGQSAMPHPFGGAHHESQTRSLGGPTSKQQIAIPTMCAGGVIGKGGHRIREIQAQSETTIQIAPADTATPHERIVSISGPSSGIATAVALIRHAVEQEYQPTPTAGGY